MKKCLLYLVILIIINVHNPFASSLDLTYRGYGISIGNSKKINGVRFNFADNGVERINGLNFTFWKPKDNPDAVINGFSFGLVGSEAKEIIGLVSARYRFRMSVSSLVLIRCVCIHTNKRQQLPDKRYVTTTELFFNET